MARADFHGQFQIIAPDVELGDNIRLSSFVNLYGCVIGDDATIGAFVEIQRGASVGRACKISSHTFVCEGVELQDEVFVGHGVMFINDRYPRATTAAGMVQEDQDWSPAKTLVGKRATIGSGATVMGGVSIGAGAMVGAGAVVTKDVPAGMMAIGVPARVIGPAPDAEALPS